MMIVIFIEAFPLLITYDMLTALFINILMVKHKNSTVLRHKNRKSRAYTMQKQTKAITE